LKLGAITDRKDFKVAAEKSLRLFANKLHELPQAVPYLLLGLDYWLEEPKRVVIVSDPNAMNTRALILAAHSVYQPNKVVLGNTGPVEPFAKTLRRKTRRWFFFAQGRVPAADQRRCKDQGDVEKVVFSTAPIESRATGTPAGKRK